MMMRILLTTLLIVCAISASAQEPPSIKYALVIHGGAGKAPSTPEGIAARERILKQALDKGHALLKSGKPSLDVVEAVILILEDSEHFNAGKGAVLNAVGKHELDASIMDGRNRSAGAVGGVRTVKHPISLARLVMTDTRHVLLATDGAEKFADRYPQIERVPNEYFSTNRQRNNLERAQEREQKDSKPTDSSQMGTVGCVALDTQGNLAAGTSTGGLTNKQYGRIGDSPIVCAGTFADNETCGVSCTGVGEDYIRNAVAYDVSARMQYKGDSLEKAVHDILNHPRHQVRGGIIAIDRRGNITMQFNTAGMSRAALDSTGKFEIHVKD
ncbi:MAG: isoaspartyl peptidase/L-asparaginase [Planctomycetaceae bacterium]|nr:isoaspartyl peptidase/L-asparaginase [Planctomycetaceae bacterium]